MAIGSGLTGWRKPHPFSIKDFQFLPNGRRVLFAVNLT
jgi:hypothetical protein